MAAPTKAKQKKMDKDAKSITDLAEIGCTYDEIATLTGIDRSTIIRKYQDLYKKGVSNLKKSLRVKNVALALAGDTKALDRMSKYYLKMNDKAELIISQGDAELDDLNEDDLVEIAFNEHNNVVPVNKQH